MLTTSPTQQSPTTTTLPPPAADESFCTWLYDRINHIFQTILSWLCCCCPRAGVTTPAFPGNPLPYTTFAQLKAACPELQRWLREDQYVHLNYRYIMGSAAVLQQGRDVTEGNFPSINEAGCQNTFEEDILRSIAHHRNQSNFKYCIEMTFSKRNSPRDTRTFLWHNSDFTFPPRPTATAPVTNTRRTPPPVSPTISDPEPTPTEPTPPPPATAPADTTPAVVPPSAPAPAPAAPATPDEWFPVVEPYIQSQERRNTLPRAQSRSPVYFTDQFVIKHCNTHHNATPAQERFDRTETARSLCAREGYQRIVVPEARLYGDFIVERRLPLTMRSMKEQIGLYIAHRDAFTQTAREFAAMLCKAHDSDIIGNNQDPYGHMVEGAFARYDNATLYLEGGEGRIGMVDLEEFGLRAEGSLSSMITSKWFSACEAAICFFPLHYNEILDTIRQAGGTLTPDQLRELETLRTRSLHRFQVAYNNHVDFLRAKNITLASPLAPPVISPERKTAVLHHLARFLQNRSSIAVDRIQEQLPNIWNIALNFVSQLLNSRTPPNPTLPENLRFIEMISSRSFIIHNGRLSPYRAATNAIEEKLTMIPDDDRERIARELLDELLTELARGQDIAYYKPTTRGQYMLFC